MAAKNLPTGKSLRALFESLGKQEEIAGYGADSSWNESIQFVSENDTSHTVSCEGVSRSILDNEESFLHVFQNACKNSELKKEFDVQNADIVFRNAELVGSDSDYVQYEYWLANPEKNWLVIVTGGMGSYCDENYDATADFEFDIDCDASNLEQKISARVTQWSAQLSASLQKSVNEVLETVPENQRAALHAVIVNQFKKTDFFAPILADKENQEITSHVNQVDGVDQKISSKNLKI